MPAKKYLSMLMIGFVFSAYLNVPMFGVSIIGLALAYYFFTTESKKLSTNENVTFEEEMIGMSNKVEKKDLTKAAIRYMFMACNVFNYENQQGPAVVFGLEKVLRKIYQNDENILLH